MALIKRSDWPVMGGSPLSDFFDDDRFFSSPWLRGESVPAVNIRENDASYEIELAAPGFDKKDFNVSLEQGVLTISAEKKQDTEKKEDRYTRREFNYATFSRSFTLPKNISEEDIKAVCENGVLKLSIAKKQQRESKPKKAIEIK